MSTQRSGHGQPSGWAVGFTVFAATMMVIAGALQFLEGLAAVMKDVYFVVGDNYAFKIDTTAYGWTHIVIGLALVVVGVGVFLGQAWARWTGIVITGVAMMANFLFIPYYPLWAIVLIALDLAVIWALSQRALR
jgi:hypothetical protein